MIASLKQKYGNKCTGVKINYDGDFKYARNSQMRFCEAISYSFITPVLIESIYLSCLGSKRNFGLSDNEDEIIKNMSAESKINTDLIRKSLNEIPKFDTPVNNFLLGMSEEMEKEIKPDLFILMIKPKDVMDLIRDYMSITNKFPIITPFTFLSVCGNVLVKTLKENKMTISLGCSESRIYAEIDDDLMIIGIPYEDCKKIYK